MDIVERLTLEAAAADTMLACEHRQRYEFAAPLSAGKRVLDLCCGTGYGTAILAAQAAEVVGVDNDAGTVELAAATIGHDFASVRFELADAVEFLTHDVVSSFDVVVCFEGLEHLRDLDRALAALRDHAGRGLQVVASIPNGKLFKEQNPYHVTEFGYDEAVRAFAGFPSTVMLPQFLAEGSLICPAGAEGIDVTVSLEDRDEPEYANHFIFCVNFDPDAIQRSHHGRIQLNTSPVFNRWAEDLKRGAWALRRENTRLARARLGKAGSAAASALAGVTNREAQVSDLRQRCEAAEARLRELQLALASVEERELPAGGPRGGAKEIVVDGQRGDLPGAGPDLDGDPNTWEHRRRRAADALIPWIEQTVPLAGKTVLEYGCGNAAVSCAFAERAERLIGVDIDPGWIELGNEEVRNRGLQNVELELHPLESIIDAVSARRGQVDVFLLYAVLEHLTVAERLRVLRLAREVVKPDGAIVVCETPNRLIYFDHHTAQMPFFHLLPDELAADYYHRSARADFRDAIDQAAAGGRAATLEAIVRWGRGVSFHEFELVFGDRLDRHVLASNYDPLLFAERPVHPDEVILARYLDRWRPDLAPVWSRYWLDVILSPTEISKRKPFLRPWSAETIASDRVGWTRWENMYLSGRESTLEIDLPHPTEQLVVGSVTEHERPLALEVTVAESDLLLSADATGPRGETRFTTFELTQPAQWVTLRPSDECNIVFVGFDD
ncbi:MAG TPA: methyltransferase domain-containing protein [Solirubrobacteraceae bacterium]|jgi:2-polyprenyl-3-methyl-5-hydroxy-6-metoxy-1,4-benzoquinol methylase|nr:methyltransferase domain-containing protein [Solirubrobacteraceae bacterium]